MLKKIKLILCSIIMVFVFCFIAKAEDSIPVEEPEITTVTEEIVESPNEFDEQVADEMSVSALENYDMSGSLFEKITLLEQDKVVLQLEKERAQLDLELERLNAEKIKLQMELDTLSGRAEHQQQELEIARAQLEAQAEKLKQQKEALSESENKVVKESVVQSKKVEKSDISEKYRLINIVGMGNQLQATLSELSTGQNKRVAVGKNLDGYVIKSISLNDGIVFEKDGVTEVLNIGK